MKNFYKISLSWQVRKKFTVINSILVALTILLSICFGSYYASLQNNIKNDVYSNLRNYRILYVVKSINGIGGSNNHEITEIDANDIENFDFESLTDKDEFYQDVSIPDEPEIDFTEEELEEQKQELFSIEHVVNASNSYAFYLGLKSSSLKTLTLDGEIWLNSATNESLPEIVLGNKFPDEEGNYLICPENFYPDSNLYVKKTYSIFDKKDIKSLLNKTITFQYESLNQTTTYEINYKIVGFYKNNESYIDENECFATNKSLVEIGKNEYSDDFDTNYNINNIVFQKGFYVEVDKIENLDVVKDSLAELGYVYESTVFFSETAIKNVENNAKKYTFLVVLFGFIIILIVLKKQNEEDKENYKMLIYLGYKKRDIIKIFILSSLTQVMISLILTVILSILLFGIALLGLYIFPFLLNKWKLFIDISYSILAVIMLFVAMFINVIFGIIILRKGFYELHNN